ncbi:hypothetical protein [Methylibium sp.]|jgi:hypothetical protein|uniref:hypothetical protein n=1 Tax=Methylibium sp. TaxID=2067992 RepID=UPI003340E930
MTTRTSGVSRGSRPAPDRRGGMPAWLHRVTAAIGALSIGLLSAFVIAVGGSRPTEASPGIKDGTPTPSGELARCGEHSDKAERHWCLARWTASAPAALSTGL